MKKRVLGKTGMEVTPIGFGVLTIGHNQLDLPVNEGAAILRYALESGINFIDTAQYYQTYPYIKAALKGLSFDPVIVSKSLDPTYTGMKYAIEEARRELDRDYIDIFLLHEVRDDPDWELRSEAWRCLKEAKSKGIIKAIGVSTHHVEVAERIANIKEADVLFPLINYKSLGIRKGKGQGKKEEMAKAIACASMNEIGVFAMKVFGGGILIEDYVKALDYIKSLKGIVSMMMGFGNKKEIDAAISYIEESLPHDYKPDLSSKKIWIDQGDCEGCGSCIKRCPNQAIYLNKKGLANVNYDICLTCGYCAPICPVRAIIMIG